MKSSAAGKRIFDRKTHAYGIALVVLGTLTGVAGFLNIVTCFLDAGVPFQQQVNNATPVALVSSFACLAGLFIGQGLKAESREDPSSDVF